MQRGFLIKKGFDNIRRFVNRMLESNQDLCQVREGSARIRIAVVCSLIPVFGAEPSGMAQLSCVLDSYTQNQYKSRDNVERRC